ncbi:MAG: hypothetical protein WBL67_00465 [Nitrososphaeraceae archaeon]
MWLNDPGNEINPSFMTIPNNDDTSSSANVWTIIYTNPGREHGRITRQRYYATFIAINPGFN